MKKIIFLVLVSIAIVNAQDTEPSAFNFRFNTVDSSYSNTPLKQEILDANNFVISSQWGGNNNMLKALKFTTNQTKAPGPYDLLQSNSDTVNKLNHIWQNFNWQNARGFTYEPTLFIPDSSRGKLITRTSDTTKAIWGFSQVRGTIRTNPIDTNYDRLLLFKDSMSTYGDSVVLKNTWINNKFFAYDPSKYGDSISGTRWIFSMNLRRRNLNEVGGTSDTLLSIRLPYSYRNTDTTFANAYIKFSQIPKVSLADTARLDYFEDRGIAMKMSSGSGATVFYILNSMLPDYIKRSQGYKNDITLNAEFICDGVLNNKVLKDNILDMQLDKINNIDIEVKYYGRKDVAINWLRITTPQGYDYYTGKYDSQNKAIYQAAIDSIESYGLFVKAFYGLDEHGEEYFNEQRYKSRLFNFCAISEGAGGEHFDHYNYHEEVKNVWVGAMNVLDVKVAPYRNTHLSKSDTTFISKVYNIGLTSFGDGGEFAYTTYESAIWPEYSRSNYQKWLDFWNPNIDSMSGQYGLSGMNYYRDQMISGPSLIGSIDYQNYEAFFRNPSLIYGNKKWWQNLFLGGRWNQVEYINNTDTNYYAMLKYSRPQTGEEARYNIWRALIFGAKGLAYDAHCEHFIPDTIADSKSMLFLNNEMEGYKYDTASVETLLYSNDATFGVDYIPNPDYSTDIHHVFNYDSVAKYLGVRKDRIYYGRKSTKTEMFKLHTFIKHPNIENILMNLKIAAAYSKGFRCWHNWDVATYGNSDLLKRFIKYDTVNVIFKTTSADTTRLASKYIVSRSFDRSYNDFETWDSTYFDLTLHRDINTSIDSVFYLGILNRRTDPRIMTRDTLLSPYEVDSTLKFYTTSEFDHNIKFGGYRIDSVFKDTTWWRDMWWERFGAREITIPFNYKHPTDTNNYRLLEIEEIADTSLSARNTRSWTNTEVVKTVIGQDGLVKLKMLPGEGKILKVRVIQPSNNLDGILDYSNQNKLICMKSLADTSKIRYFATYYKHDTIGGVPTNRVYFATSQTISKEAPTEQIQWNQPPMLVSYKIKDASGVSELTNASCDYPSIVSKQVNDSTISHYIVFQCKGGLTSPTMLIEENIANTFKRTTISGIREFDTLTNIVAQKIGVAQYNDVFSRNVGYKDYGNPVISAIDSGVVTAWSSAYSDSSPIASPKLTIRYHKDDGITSGVKAITIDTTSFPQFTTDKQKIDFRHPSLNSYSLNDSLKYNNASTLVWQQINPNDITNSYISMTHIKLDGGNLVKYLPRLALDSMYNFANGSIVPYGSDTSIIQFRWGARAGNLPTVYKTYGGIVTNDYLVWERHWDDDYIQLYGVVIKNYNTTPNRMKISRGLQLSHNNSGSGTKRLSLPNLGTPSELLIGNFNYIPNGNSANLNFNYNDKMLHTSFLGNTIIGIPDSTIDNQYIADNFNEIATGNYSHLSNSPFNNTFGNTWRNRRIFNMQDTVIQTSARYFYKTNNGGTEINKFVGFANDTSKFSFCDVFQNGNFLKLNTNSTYDTNFEETDYSSSDSIYSDWFTVGTSCNVEFVYKAVNYSGNYHVYIQRKDSNSNTTLTMVPTSDNSRHVLLNLINGNGHEYRLCVQSISNAKYLDEVVFGSLNGDTLFLKGSKHDTRTISLNQSQNIVSKVYPNPASEEVFVEINKSYDLVREMTLELYDQVGKLYQVKACKSGEKVKLDIQNYPKGSYYLSLKGYLDGSETSETIKFEVIR